MVPASLAFQDSRGRGKTEESRSPARSLLMIMYLFEIVMRYSEFIVPVSGTSEACVSLAHVTGIVTDEEHT